jgi:nucleotide-binding universal stress UspA family protein
MFNKILFYTDFSENAHWAFTYALYLARIYQGDLLILHVANHPFYLFTDGLTPYRSSKALASVEASEKENMDQGKEKKVKYTCPCGFSSYDLMEFLKHPFMEYPLEQDEKDSKKLEEEEK